MWTFLENFQKKVGRLTGIIHTTKLGIPHVELGKYIKRFGPIWERDIEAAAEEKVKYY